MMINLCDKCGIEIPKEHHLCKECYKKQKELQEEARKKFLKKDTKEKEGIDLGKNINIPTWTLIAAFIIGAIIGGYLF